MRLFGVLIAVCAAFALGFMQGEVNQLDAAWSLCQEKIVSGLNGHLQP